MACQKGSENLVDNLLNYTYSKLISRFEAIGLTKLDAKKVYPWLFQKKTISIDQMSDVAIKTRNFLKEHFTIQLPHCELLQTSIDGTMKALLILSDGENVENVLIRDENRITLCMSTQIGCPMKCKFCNTGTQQFVRNLTCAELIGQYIYWENFLSENHESITNIVVMGMGEPFLNLENLSDWLEIMLDKRGINMSRHRITISTSGVTDNLLEFGKKFKVQLAISLHASNNTIRDKIMPVNKKYSIDKIIDVVRKYPAISNTEYVTFEYLMLNGINDTMESAKELQKILTKVKCRVNLIMYNEWPGNEFKRSNESAVVQFQQYLKKHGIMCTVRKSKGRDILAACGQLKSKYSC